MTTNIVEKSFVDNTFYINSFFRETKDGSKIGLMFKGTIFDGEDSAKFVLYHIDSKRTGKHPFLILDTDALKSLNSKFEGFAFLEDAGTETSIEEGNLSISFEKLRSDGEILLSFKYAGKNFSLPINRGEFEVFMDSIAYIRNYDNKRFTTLSTLRDEIVFATDSVIREGMKASEITMEQVFKNKWITAGGELKKYDNPAIQYSVHGAKSVSGTLTKVHYYLKFFPTYLKNSFRKNNLLDDPSLSRTSGANFPIHIITQETGKPSAMISMSENELGVFYRFLKSPRFFLENPNHPVVHYANEYDIVKVISDRYVLSMKNEYNGKVYTNEDTISKEQYEEIVRLQSEGNIGNIVTYVKGLGLEKNKFVNDKTVATMEVRKNDFVNFKVSRTDDGKIDDRAAFLQISYNVETSEYIMTMAKGDTRDGGHRYISAPFKENEARGLLFKVFLMKKYLTDPEMVILDEIDRNLKTLDFLPNVDGLDTIVEGILTKERSNIFFTPNDTKFAKKFEIAFENGNVGTFSVFAPDTLHVFNTEAFSEWDKIEKLKDHKYPLRFSMNGSDGIKMFPGFILDLSDLGGIENVAKKEGNQYALMGKSGTSYRQLSFTNVGGSVKLAYADSSSVKGPFPLKDIGMIGKEAFEGIFKEVISEVVVNVKTNLQKSIQYHKLNILEPKEVEKTITV